jgi:hypothetical protein
MSVQIAAKVPPLTSYELVFTALCVTVMDMVATRAGDGKEFSLGNNLPSQHPSVNKVPPLAAKLWDAQTGQELPTIKTGAGCFVFSPDGRRLACGCADNMITVWDALNDQENLTFLADAEQSIAFSPDGRRVASDCVDRTVKVWDAQTGQRILTLTGHTVPVMSVVFNPDGKHLASAGGGRRSVGGGWTGRKSSWERSTETTRVLTECWLCKSSANLRNLSSRRATSTRFIPTSASRRAKASPIPEEAPVTSAQGPKRSTNVFMLVSFPLAVHDGKHLPKATSSFGDPLMRMRRRNKAHSRLRSFARKPSHVSLSAVT